MGITSLSSLSLERWWKFVYLFVGAFVYFVFVVSLILVHWNISNPNINESFINFFEANIIWIYLVLGVWFVDLASVLLVFVKLVRIKVDEQNEKIYVNDVEVDRRNIRLVAEMASFDMLFVLMEIDGKLKTWIPKKSPYRDTLWPLPFFYRKAPKNKYAKLLHSILSE